MNNGIPFRQIRADFTDETIRVYQAYSQAIGKPAVEEQTFSPPFSRSRMTWIKPSFLWMMYRSGWGTKPGQEVVLAIDITRTGFEWALSHACLSDFKPAVYQSHEEWAAILEQSPVRIQWDPERDLHLHRLDYRSIQIGLSRDAVDRYIDEWIVKISDVTPVAREIESLIRQSNIDAAKSLMPNEKEYVVSDEIMRRVGMQEDG